MSIDYDLSQEFYLQDNEFLSYQEYEEENFRSFYLTLTQKKFFTLSEMFVEWFLLTDSNKSISDFLMSEKIDHIFSENDFNDLMAGKAFLSNSLCKYIVDICPFKITSSQMYKMNPVGDDKKEISFDEKRLIQERSKLRKQSEQDKKQRRAEYYQTWKSQNYESLLEYWKKYNSANKEQRSLVKKEIYQRNKEYILKRNNEYRQRPDVKLRMVQQRKERYEKDKEKILAQQKDYYNNNKDDIRERRRQDWAKNKDKYNARQKMYREHRKEKKRIQLLSEILYSLMQNAQQK